MSEAKAIASKIDGMAPGSAFTAADFSDVSSARNAGNVLGRMCSRGKISKAMRGVYYVPRRSKLLGADVPAGVEDVVEALARANKWVIAPAGDAALNAVGLDTQVPAKFVYVSSGPYKKYTYGPYEIELRHRANRDLLDCTRTTCVIVQALKALGKEGVDEEVISVLARKLSTNQVKAFRDESSWMTSWVTEAAKRIYEEKNG